MRGWILALLIAAGCISQAQARIGFAEANGVSLRYELQGGGGSAIVLIHEIGMTLEGWDEVVPRLRGGHQVLRYDLRGFGLSQKFSAPISLEDEVADLHGLLAALHIAGKVTLVGGAVGGNIALAYAADYPDQVRGVIVFSPLISAPGAAGLPVRRMTGPMAPSPADIIAKSGMRGYLAIQAASLYPPFLRTDPARYARFVGIQMASDPTSRIATVRMASTGNFAEIIPKVRCPALMVATIYFTMSKPTRVQLLAAALPHGSFLALPTGHLAGFETPDLVAQTINQFVAKD